MALQCVYLPKSDENGCFYHFSRYFILKALARRLYMLRELWRVFNMAHQKQYKGGLNSLPVLKTYTMTLQCVYSRKSDENQYFNHFSRYFTLKAGTRRLCMLRELCTTFKTAHHNQYQCSLHSQPVRKAYTMTLQCVYSRKSDENRCF